MKFVIDLDFDPQAAANLMRDVDHGIADGRVSCIDPASRAMLPKIALALLNGSRALEPTPHPHGIYPDPGHCCPGSGFDPAHNHPTGAELGFTPFGGTEYGAS